MHKQCVIPLPPDAVATAAKGETKQAIGLYPCINDGACPEYILIKLDNSGNPYGTCSPHEVNVRGCSKRRVNGAPEDIPPQTYEAYQTALETVQELKPIPDVYLRHLENAWAKYIPEEVDHEGDSSQDGE